MLICLLSAGCWQACGEVLDRESAGDTDPTVSHAWEELAERARHGPCTAPAVARPPTDLGLDGFYDKYVDACGIPVVGSGDVDDQALLQAARITIALTKHRPRIREQLVSRRLRIAVLDETEPVTVLPEYVEAGMDGDLDPTVRGVPAKLRVPLVSTSEENLLCRASDRNPEEILLIRDLALTMIRYHASGGISGPEGSVEHAYAQALTHEIWKYPSPATRDYESYWAEGAQSWFDANDPEHELIATREQLQREDPTLAALLESVYGSNEVDRCPKGGD